MANSRARATGLPTSKPLLQVRRGLLRPRPVCPTGRTRARRSPGRPARPRRRSRAAANRPGRSARAFQALPVTTVVGPEVSLATTLAGPAVVLVAAIAMVLAPARTAALTSTVVARFHESVARRDELTATPLTHTSAVSSPVTTSVVRPAAPRSKVRRKYRVAAGAEAAGSPSGYQIHAAPVRSAVTGAPMKSAVPLGRRVEQPGVEARRRRSTGSAVPARPRPAPASGRCGRWPAPARRSRCRRSGRTAPRRCPRRPTCPARCRP